MERQVADRILFDKLRFIDRLKSAGIDNQARAHAEAMDEALRESVATKLDIALAVRDMTIRMGAIAIALFAALASIKFFW
jgi:hypothetical protein